MAHGMKYWIGIVATGCALVAIWLLPPNVASTTSGWISFGRAAEIRYDAISEEYRWTYEALRRVRWSDSLTAVVVGGAVEGVAIAMPDGTGVLDDRVERLEIKIREEITGFGGQLGSMVFGFVYQPYDHGVSEGHRTSNQDRTETYIGSRDGMDYCLQVRTFHRGDLPLILARDLTDTDVLSPKSGVLGPCRFYLKYGLAGAGIQGWLEEGASAFAMESGSEGSTQSDFTRRGYLGFRTVSRSRGWVIVSRCLAGYAEACGQILLDPARTQSDAGHNREIVRRSPVVAMGTGPFSAYSLPDEGYMIADLEAEFGSEAFGKFWTSDESAAAAFEDAFGVDAGTWTLSWATSVRGIDPPGPGLPRSASSGSMLAVGLLLGIAFMRARKQKVA